MDHASWAASTRLFTEDAVQEKFEGWFGADNIQHIGEALRSAPALTTLRQFRAADNTKAIIAEIQESVGPERIVSQHPVIESCIVIAPKEGSETLIHHPQSVVVDYKCGEAVLRGADVFAPGILAASCRFDPGAKLNVLVAINPNETPLKGSMVERNLCGSDSTSLLHVASGVANMSRAEVVKPGASGIAIRIVSRVVDHPPMDGVANACLLQNIPSMLPPFLLRPEPGQRVIDMCAAPGGKTTHVLDLMERKGELVALDRSGKRLAELKLLAEKAGGAECVVCAQQDATKSVKKYGERSFDRVMLDPPCSGLGLRPRLRHDMKLKELEEFASYQRRLLTAAYNLCKVGGRIVFSTCSISPIENEGNVAWFLATYREKVRLETPTDETRKYYELGSKGMSLLRLFLEPDR